MSGQPCGGDYRIKSQEVENKVLWEQNLVVPDNKVEADTGGSLCVKFTTQTVYIYRLLSFWFLVKVLKCFWSQCNVNL